MLDKTVTDWRAASTQLAFEGRAFINGRYVHALSGATRPTMNPANGEELTQVASCGPEDADLAVAGARKAFEHGDWSQMASHTNSGATPFAPNVAASSTSLVSEAR